MVSDSLTKWRDEYQKRLNVKKDQYTEVSEKIEIISSKISEIQQNIDSDEQLFSPNNMYNIDQNRLDAAKFEKNELVQLGEKLNQSISYLENRIDQLNDMIEELILKENMFIQNSSERKVKDNLLFISSIIESDPRRSKIELLNILDKL